MSSLWSCLSVQGCTQICESQLTILMYQACNSGISHHRQRSSLTATYACSKYCRQLPTPTCHEQTIPYPGLGHVPPHQMALEMEHPHNISEGTTSAMAHGPPPGAMHGGARALTTTGATRRLGDSTGNLSSHDHSSRVTEVTPPEHRGPACRTARSTLAARRLHGSVVGERAPRCTVGQLSRRCHPQSTTRWGWSAAPTWLVWPATRQRCPPGWKTCWGRSAPS